MTQKAMILKYMEQHGSISSMEAFGDLGITRLAARIAEIIDAGYKINKVPETSVNRFGDTVRYMRYKKAV